MDIQTPVIPAIPDAGTKNVTRRIRRANNRLSEKNTWE
jgi:hypothetical protein